MTEPEARVRALVRGAGRVADGADAIGERARAILPAATGLSREGVELCLREYLETAPADGELAALVRSVSPVRAAHVVLSAGVFVAAHRAIALGLAASEAVFVKPSRRDPEMTRLLADAAPGAFTIVDELSPEAGDTVFAYGTDEALQAIRIRLPPGVLFRGHGAGFGVAVVDARAASDSELELAAASVSRDVVPFDQRGCLSPRIAIVRGSAVQTRTFSEALARSLTAAERTIPRGRLSADEAAESTRYRDTMRYAASLFVAGSGLVGFDPDSSSVVIPPVGRNVHVVATSDVPSVLAPISRWVTAIGIQGSKDFAESVVRAVPSARSSPLGLMQKPPFDGPVDRRSG